MKRKEIGYNNLTEEQLNSWKKDRIDQELIDRFIEIYTLKEIIRRIDNEQNRTF